MQREIQEYKKDWKKYKSAAFESNVKLREN